MELTTTEKTPSAAQLFRSEEACAEYERLVHDFQAYLLEKGVRKAAFSERGLDSFRSFSLQNQLKFVAQLRNYVSICREAECVGIDALRNARGMLQFIKFKMRITIPDEFTNALCEQDIVEIFDYEGTQLYRNITFFDISDYTIDDFFGQTWDYLYERSSHVTKKIFERVALTASAKACVPFDVPEHYMRERATPNRKIVKVCLKNLAPLLSDGEPIAWAASSSALEVISRSDEQTETMTFI